MRMLGEIVAALRVANGWSLQELADRVQQEGAKNVKYQHLQQLEAKPNTSPRYIVELARSFGKTVEDLREWETGQPPFGPNHAAAKHVVGEFDYPMFSRKAAPQEFEERSLIEDFRACTPEVQQAIRLVISASRPKPQPRAR